MIEQNVRQLLQQIPPANPFGEKVTVVAAVKYQTVEAINQAIKAGICAIGDNHVQEFRDKYDGIEGEPSRQFIGHLQTNKVKYLIGKCDLYQSVDRMELAREISKRSVNANVVSHILVQINIGNEESKGGFDYENAQQSIHEIASLPNLCLDGLMAMLPISDDTAYLGSLVDKMRALYDALACEYPTVNTLSMGMSGDWQLCVKHGANMIRVGTTLFGARDRK